MASVPAVRPADSDALPASSFIGCRRDAFIERRRCAIVTASLLGLVLRTEARLPASATIDLPGLGERDFRLTWQHLHFAGITVDPPLGDQDLARLSSA